MMIQKIVFATDFSPLSEEALHYTINLAGKTGARVIGVHVLTPVAPLYSPFQPEEGYKRELEKQTRTKLKAFFAPIAGETKVEIETRLCLGVPERTLSELVIEEQADLLVVAKHSRSTLGRFFMGSTTEKIVREARCPVLVVPDAGVRTVTWKPILCATDLSQPSLKAFQFGIQLAQDYQANLNLMHVIDLGFSAHSPEEKPTEYILSISKSAKEKLEDIITTRGGPGETEIVVVEGKPAVLIVERAEELGSDLVILGKSGHTLAEQRVLGSTANAILRGARFPVLVIPGP
jgi:nucleotide-binding universal stress UspA family protein